MSRSTAVVDGRSSSRGFRLIAAVLGTIALVAAGSVGAADAREIPSGIACGYAQSGETTIEFFGSSIWHRHKRLGVTRERRVTNPQPYPAYASWAGSYASGWQIVDSTGYRGGEYISVSWTSVQCRA